MDDKTIQIINRNREKLVILKLKDFPPQLISYSLSELLKYSSPETSVNNIFIVDFGSVRTCFALDFGFGGSYSYIGDLKRIITKESIEKVVYFANILRLDELPKVVKESNIAKFDFITEKAEKKFKFYLEEIANSN